MTLEDNNDKNDNNDNKDKIFPLDMTGTLKFLPTSYHQDQRFSAKLPNNSVIDEDINNNLVKINNKLNELKFSELMKAEDLTSSSSLSSIISPEISSLLISNRKMTLVLINSSGIHKVILNTKKSRIEEIQTYQFPSKFIEDLNIYNINKPCLHRLNRCIYENYLLFEQYKDRVQTMELYNLMDMRLEQTLLLKDDIDDKSPSNERKKSFEQKLWLVHLCSFY